ncbi:MAG TPA: SDR family NAD(P)-dependent oxidoreductase [Kribbellaceae bacterium]|jgi:NAD(P)-dependent dehydrogenase (short-subunit alcohol dehydrogenase family)
MTAGSASLSGRKVLVTGANRGVGAAFVQAALARGAAAVVAAARNPASVPRFDGASSGNSGTSGTSASGSAGVSRVVPVRLDVRDGDTIAAAAREHGDVDLLVSNAAVTHQAPVLAEGDEDALRDLMDTNFFGPLRLVRGFRDSLRRPGSGVIFVLSVAAVTLSRSSPVYGASKAASLMLALALREELRDYGATVTAALPGYIDTDMAAGFDSPKASPIEVAERTLDGWLAGEPTVWPDLFAELVRDAVGEPFRKLLDEPRGAMVGVHAAFARGT